MAGYVHGENNFSDDDLDELPLNTLAELEHNAIQFTQAANTQAPLKPAPAPASAAPPSSDYGDDFEDEDLDDAVVVDESRSTPALITTLNGNHRGPATQREPFRQQRYGNPSSSGLKNPQRPDVPLYLPNRDNILGSSAGPQNDAVTVKLESQVANADDTEGLRRQLEELRKKNQALEESINVKAGEVAIVRSKQEKEAKAHERELNALRKISEEKLAKQRKELEAARIAANNASTERDFVKQDLAESERVRRLNKAAEKKDTLLTPKKKKALSHRDGFDDDEIEVISPSKLSPSKFRPRNGTPTKPAKRKRKAVDSPTPALDVIQADESSTREMEQTVPIFDEALIARLGVQDDRFDFLGTMLDHRPSENHLRTIEALGNYALPSKPEESFESIILGQIPTLGFKRPSSTDLPIEFCELLISIWSKCLDEKYLKPLYLFVDILTLALELKTIAIAPYIVNTLVPLVQRTAEVVVSLRFRRKPLEGHDEFINVSSCLELLYLAALGCMSESKHILQFWSLMRVNMIVMLLSQNQPTEDFETMLKLLSTSVLRDSFGMVLIDDPQTQRKNMGYILDYLSQPLIQVPYQHNNDNKIEPHAVLKLRLEILQLLISMTRSPFASQAMATHQDTVPRLVCLMSDELDVLYDWRAGHESSARIVTLATRLLYHLVTKHEHEINMQQKLTRIHGGSQKYLLVLARLNFLEDDLVLESSIAPDVPELAHEMLENAVTPDEGDQLLGAFLAP